MRNLQDVGELQNLKSMGQLNRSGERRLERKEQRVMRDYNRGLVREQRNDEKKFMSDTGATTGVAATSSTPTNPAQNINDRDLLADMMRKNKMSQYGTFVSDVGSDPFTFK